MGTARTPPRLLPDGSPLHNRLLLALPNDVYLSVCKELRMMPVAVGETLLEHGIPISHVFFPNSGVYSVTNEMKDGSLVEVATVGFEGMLGANVFLGDSLAAGRSLLQVPNGALPRMPVTRFAKLCAETGPFRTAVSHYIQAHTLTLMQGTACNALHGLEQRCCRWLLQTHDRVRSDEFLLKHEFMAIMLGTTRPWVTKVIGTLQKNGLIASHYGRITILDRKKLERASCECYEVIAGHFKRLGA
jgi:CRP-like cAMP-binding protein